MRARTATRPALTASGGLRLVAGWDWKTDMAYTLGMEWGLVHQELLSKLVDR